MKIKPLETKSLVVVAVGVIWLALRLSADINGVSFLMMMSSYRLGTSVLLAGLVVAFLRLGVPLFPMLLKPRQKRSKTAYKGAKVALSNGVEALLPDRVEVDVENVHERGQNEVEEEPIVDISVGENNPFIRKGAVPKKVEASGKPANLYEFKDIQFDLEKVPHSLIVGESGGGKTITSYSIINMLNKQYNYPRIAILDMGNLDYETNIGTTMEDFYRVLDLFYIILKGRQKEGKVKDRTRIIWIIEEFEAALAGLTLLPKAKRDKVEARLGNISRMARKTSVNLFFVVQSGRGSEFSTATRNNFGNVFVHRSPKNLSQMFSCPHNLTNIPTGVTWFGKANSFVKMPLIEEPHMNLMTIEDIVGLAKYYQRRFGIEQNIDITTGLEIKDEA